MATITSPSIRSSLPIRSSRPENRDRSSIRRRVLPRRRISVLVVTIFTAGCGADGGADASAGIVIDTLASGAVYVQNPADGIWDRAGEGHWRLVKELRIGRAVGEGPDVFGRIGSLVEDPLGRLWVADPMAAEIRVFGRDGSHVRSIGRKGEGPGEFQDPRAMLLGPDGNIWVDDARLLRWEVFDTAGVRVAGYPGKSNLGGGIRLWTADGRLLEANVHFTRAPGSRPESRAVYYGRRLEPDGSLEDVDSVLFPDLPPYDAVHFRRTGSSSYSIRQVLPLSHRPRAIVGADGDNWITDGGGTYTIRRQRMDGDTLLVIEREYEPVPVSTAALATAAEALVPPEGMLSDDNDADRLASVHPPFEDYFPATDGTLWVRRATADGQVFDVFDAEGRYLGVPELPMDAADLEPRLITHERVYAVVEDELEVQRILILRIERP